MSTFIGVDVSRWQGDINFDQLATAVSFVIYKGTGGDNGLYVDSEFLRNHAQARAHNMDRGIYHFGGSGDATAEADYFYQQCLTNLEPGELVMLDAESGSATNPDWCLTFLQHLESLIGFKPMIYMNHNLMMTEDWSKVSGANYGLWLADWDGDPNTIVTMKYWAFCAIQQYADDGRVAGIAGNVDEDGFFAPSLDFWQKYGKPVPTPAPAPVDTSAGSGASTPTPSTAPDSSSGPTSAPSAGASTTTSTTSSSTPTSSVPLPGLTNNVPTPPGTTIINDPLPPTTTPTPAVPKAPPEPVVVGDGGSILTKGEAVIIRVFHTFWQSFVGVFGLSATGLIPKLLSVHTFSDAKSFAIAAASAIAAAVLSTIKNLLSKPKEAE